MKIKPSLLIILILIAILALPTLGISLANLGFLLLLLLCPLMHYLLMRGTHGGHVGHGKPESEGKPELREEPDKGEGTKPDLEVK